MTAPAIDLDNLTAVHCDKGLLLMTADLQGFFYFQRENPADDDPKPTQADGKRFVTELIRLARIGQHAEGRQA